ncbi:MAG: hypothetical protein KDD32_00475 [Bacteroidetes bacterium]|nr:hypothetical protein [Bacteroidota bacterium]
MDQTIDLYKTLIRGLMILLLAIATILHVWANDAENNSSNQSIEASSEKSLSHDADAFIFFFLA